MKNSIKTREYGIWIYLREISIVVIGVAVTFAISNWITSRKNEKDIKSYLNAVKLELQDNLEFLNRNQKYYERSLHYGRYLSANTQNLHPDTLDVYYDLNKYMPFFTYKTSAFDLLKNSGTVLLIKDKNKLQAIWNCYAELEGIRLFSDFYIQRKIAETERNTNSVLNVKPEILYPFFISILSRDLYNECSHCSKNIVQTLSQLQ